MPEGRSYYIKSGGYPTDHLIQGMDDQELLNHMDVPQHIRAVAEAGKDGPWHPEIQFWLDNLAYIFRPSTDLQKERPGLHGRGLILYGEPRRHKTTTACSLLLHVVRTGIRNSDPTYHNLTWHGWCMGRFVDWQDASELFRNAAGGRDEEEAEVLRLAMRPNGEMTRRGDFLVIDDISRERGTEFNSNELHRILRRRLNYGYPTILTTNYEPDGWQDVYGDSLAAFMKGEFNLVEFS
jgi:hypothetical protein